MLFKFKKIYKQLLGTAIKNIYICSISNNHYLMKAYNVIYPHKKVHNT